MIAWLGGQSDPPNYGKGVSFGFPSSLNVYGPAQVEAAINQDPTISAQRTLWGQQGSTVIFGNLLVGAHRGLAALRAAALPGVAADAAAAAQARHRLLPLAVGRHAAQRAEQTVVMAPTLGEALTEVFGAPPSVAGPAPSPSPGQSTAPGTTTPSAQLKALIAQANTQFEAAQTALRAGDFAEYGRQIKALQQTLSQLRSLP